MVREEKFLELSEDFWGANDTLIEVLSAREVMVVNITMKASLIVNSGTAENGSSSNDMFVVDVDEKSDGSSRAKTTLSRGAAKTTDENAPEASAAYCVPVD